MLEPGMGQMPPTKSNREDMSNGNGSKEAAKAKAIKDAKKEGKAISAEHGRETRQQDRRQEQEGVWWEAGTPV